MSNEELLKPRYKVIADYPVSPYEIGEVVYPDATPAPKFTIDKLNKYPHLFKKLEWYEDREVSEMPEYVKWGERASEISECGDVPTGVMRAVKWRLYVNGTNIFMHWGDSFSQSINVYYLQPATKEEYIHTLTQVKQ